MSTWRRHTQEIATGKRKRWEANDDESAEEPAHAEEAQAEDDGKFDDARAFAFEVVELVSQGLVNVTGAEAVLKVVHDRFEKHMPAYVPPIPKSWHRCKGMALDGKEPKFIERHFCPKADHLFPLDPKVRRCPECLPHIERRYARGTKNPLRVAYYLDLDDKITRTFASYFLAEQFSTSSEVADKRPLESREIAGSWDASNLPDLHRRLSPLVDDPDDILYSTFHCDGVEVAKGVSYTPLTGKVLRFNSKVRSLRANIWCFGWLPPHVKNYQAMLRPVAEMMAKRQPGEQPLMVYDAFLKRERPVYFALESIRNDIRGLPNATAGTQPPAYVGSCNSCHVAGQRHRNTTVVPGAVCFLPLSHSLRKDYAVEFAKHPGLAELATQPAPKKRKKQESIDSANRVLAAASKNKSAHETAKKQEAFYDVDVFTQLLPYFDRIKHNVYGQEHQFNNVIKQILTVVKNHKAQNELVFKPSIREYEVEVLGRFPELKKLTEQQAKARKLPMYPNPPWVSTKGNQEAVESIISHLRVPAGWPSLRKIFSHLGFMKTAECLQLAGPIGAYFFKQLDIDHSYRDAFIDLLYLLRTAMHKVSTPGDRAELLQSLAAVLTRLEIMLPITWNSTVIHILVCRTLAVIIEYGPYVVNNILDVERFHTLFKDMARGTRNVMKSILNHFLLLEAALANRLDPNVRVDWIREAPKGTVAGYAARLDSEDRQDRMWSPKGATTNYTVPVEDRQMLRTLWADNYSEYKAFHQKFNRTVRKARGKCKGLPIEGWKSSKITREEQKWQMMKFEDLAATERVQYAGNLFQTADNAKTGKTDSSFIRIDYVPPGSGQQRRPAYAQIIRMFTQQAYEHGPKRLVVEGRWLAPQGKCPVTRNHVVKVNENYAFNRSSKFVFIDMCYQKPVALWPFDPLGTLPEDDPRRKSFAVIDLNQDEVE
jgi:hypothetical protein